jgi:hypothetical protein
VCSKACRAQTRVHPTGFGRLMMYVDGKRLVVRRGARGCCLCTDGDRRLESDGAFRLHCVRTLLSHQQREILSKIAGRIRILLAPTVFLRQEELRYHDTAQMAFWRHHARCNLPSRWMHFICTTPPLLGPSFALMRLSRGADSKNDFSRTCLKDVNTVLRCLSAIALDFVTSQVMVRQAPGR